MRKVFLAGAAAGIMLLMAAAPSLASDSRVVTVSWVTATKPDVTLGIIGAVPSNFAAIFPQAYVTQVEGWGLGDSDLLPQECGVYVQEDVYRLDTSDKVALLTSLEANGLTLNNGTPGDSTILVSGQFVFAYTGDCASPSPSETPSASPSESPTPSSSATPTPSDSATPTPSASASPTPSVSATPSTSPEVTPPATDTQPGSGIPSDTELLLVLGGFAVVAAALVSWSMFRRG